MPVRLQLSRRKGFNLQAESLALNGLPASRVARPGRWGNPYQVVCGPAWRGTANPLPAGRWGVCCMAPPLAVFDDKAAALRDCIARYRASLVAGGLTVSVEYARLMLHGRNLACYCALDAPCHADVLLEVANQETP